MMMNYVVPMYMGTSFMCGFYRGMNAKYYFDPHSRKQEDSIMEIKDSLRTIEIMNRVGRSLVNGWFYMTFGNVKMWYHGMARMEVKLKQLDPYKYKELYVELFSYTTLRPLEKK